jgi:predicted nuclease of predicted toxin-antitoxin system
VRKILLDEGVPRPLKDALKNCAVDTVQDIGMAGRMDQEVLRRAEEGGYDVFITTDKNIRHQQNMSHVRIPIYELPTTSWLKLKANLKELIAEIEALAPERGGEINVDE